MLTVREMYRLFKQDMPSNIADAEISKVSTDSRDLGAGSVFVALKGDNFDGHGFIAKAFADGAILAVAEYYPEGVTADCPVIVVEDSLRAYQDIAAYYRDKFDIPVIGITGSNGKTSTKDILAACIGASMPVLKNYANFNNDIGVAKTLLGLTSEHRAAIVEMGMRGLGQIARLTEVARPHIAVITSITPTHIELLGSLDNIALAKAEIFKDFREQDVAVLNYDNEYTRRMRPDCRCIYFGLDVAADLVATDVVYQEESTVFTCIDKVRDQVYTVRMPLIGEHNVSNALAALAVSAVLGLDTATTLSGLEGVHLSHMRQSIERYGGVTVINDAYNASPVSMHMALKVLHSVAGGRRTVAVLGDMLELGEFAQQMHRELADHCAACAVDLVLTYGALTQDTSSRCLELGLESRHFADKSQLADCIRSLVRTDDVLLFKGSRGMRMEELIKMVFEC